MSGGHYEYISYKIDEFESDLRSESKNCKNKLLRFAFCDLLKKVSIAAHQVEWVDSGDCSEGDEEQPIKDCFNVNIEKLMLEELKEEVANLEEQIKIFKDFLK